MNTIVLTPTLSEVNVALQVANNALAAASRAVTSPIPTQIITTDYTAAVTDQRIRHVSSDDHTVTLLSAEDTYDRIFLVINAGPGNLHVISKDNEDFGILTSGQTVQLESTFTPGTGTALAPSDLQVNGVSNGQIGAYSYIVYARMPALSSQQTLSDLSNQVAQLQEVQMSYGANQAQKATTTKTAAYTMSNSDSLVPADTTSAAVPVTLPPNPINKQRAELYWAAGNTSPTFVANTGQTIAQGSPLPVSNVGGIGSTLGVWFDFNTSIWYAD